MDLAGKTALVTGGGRGIGRGIALALAERGARVVVTGRTASELGAVAAETGGDAVVVDLADRAALGRAVGGVAASHGRVDILINNAGVATAAPLARSGDDDWDQAFAVNVTAPFLLARALVPSMVEAGWGRVVTVASNAGLTGYAYTAAYGASKHAVVGLTRALAVELARTGVTVNAVCPGFVDTRMSAEAAARIALTTGRSQDEARQALAQMSPQRRLMTVGEVVHLVLSLLPDEARGVNGQSIALDGGQVMP